MTTNFTRNFSCGEMPDIEEIKVKMYSDKISYKIDAFPEVEILGFWCLNLRYWKPRICWKHFKSFNFVQKVESSNNYLTATVGFFSGPCTISLTTCWPVYVWLTFCLSSSTCSWSRLRLDWTIILQSSYSPLQNAGIYFYLRAGKLLKYPILE